MFDDYNFSEANLKVHSQVHELVEFRLNNSCGTLFYTADTGLGKSTGFIKAIGSAIWDNGYTRAKLLILVPNIKLADDCYVVLNELYPGRIGIWTSDHDSNTKSPQQAPSVRMTKQAASEHDCLIITHIAGKSAESWVGHRDVVFYDEDPEITSSTTVTLADFAVALQEEKAANRGESSNVTDILEEAKAWAEEQSSGLVEIERPTWSKKLAPLIMLRSDKGDAIHKLAKAVEEGRAFMSKGLRTQWTHYEMEIPFADHAIVFSATAMYAGYHLSPKVGDIPRDGVRVDFSNCSFKHKAWPKGMTKMQRDIVQNKPLRDSFMSSISKWVSEEGGADGDTLFVCPKGFQSDIEDLYPTAMFCTYGQGIGSNRYRTATKVFVVGEYHKPIDTHRATFLSYSGVPATQEHLDKLANNSKALQEVAKNHYYASLKQMVSRSAIRQVDGDAKAKAVTVHCMIDISRFYAGVPELFHGAVLAGNDKAVTSTGKDNTVTFISKVIKFLTEQDATEVTSKEMTDGGLLMRNRAQYLEDNQQVLLDAGWRYIKNGGSRWNPAKFIKVD